MIPLNAALKRPALICWAFFVLSKNLHPHTKSMDQTWVKIRRKIRDRGFYKKSQYIHLWLELMLRVNHKEAEVLHDGELKQVKVGCTITGRKSLAEATGIPESTVQNILKKFEQWGVIKQQTRSKNRSVCVVDYEKDTEREQQHDNSVATTEQQQTTNNNDKNEKNDNKYGSSQKRKEEAISHIQAVPQSHIQKWSAEFDASEAEIEAKLKEVMDWIKTREDFNSTGEGVIKIFLNSFPARSTEEKKEKSATVDHEKLARISETKKQLLKGKESKNSDTEEPSHELNESLDPERFAQTKKSLQSLTDKKDTPPFDSPHISR